MSDRLISLLRECRHRLSELPRRSDYRPVHCAILRVEGEGQGLLMGCDPFGRILGDWDRLPTRTPFGNDDHYSLPFFASRNGPAGGGLGGVVEAVEAITKVADEA